MLSLAVLASALLLGTPAPAPKPVQVLPPARSVPMPGCPANAQVKLTCGSPTPRRGATTVVIHACGNHIASIYAPGRADAPEKKAGVIVKKKATQAGQPEVWEGKGFSLWISGTHPMADGRSIAGLDTTALGAKQSIELACQ